MTASQQTPLVFLHGLLLNHRVWGDPQASFDLQNPAVCLDLLGHGDRADVAGDVDVRAAASDLAVQLNGLDLPAPPVLVGWSFGASVALRYALDGADVRGLVLVGATPQVVRDKAFRHGQPRAAQMMRDRAMDQDYPAALRGFADQTVNGDPAQADRLYRLLSSVPRAQATSLFASATAGSLVPELPNITVPVEVIHGKADRICAPQAGQFLAETIPTASALRPIENGSHAPFLTQPVAFRDALHGALAEIRRVSPRT
ncbi:MAG: alpha/beta hydrolase [Pseudomonadota bacterium]